MLCIYLLAYLDISQWILDIWWFWFWKSYVKISESQMMLSEISKNCSRYLLARTGVGKLVPACCCCTCRCALLLLLALQELGQPLFQHVTHWHYQPPIPPAILSVEGCNLYSGIWWAYILRWQGASLLCTMSGFALFLQASCGDGGAQLIPETSFAGNHVPNSWGTNKLTVLVGTRNTKFDNDTSYNPKYQHVFPLHQQEMMLLSWIPTASAENHVAFINSHRISRKYWFHEFSLHQQEMLLSCIPQQQQEVLLSCIPTASAENISWRLCMG